MLGLPGYSGRSLHLCTGREGEMSLTGKAEAKFTLLPFRLLGRKRNT